MQLESFNAVRVLIVGDVLLDHYVEGQVERISPEAPVPVLKWNREYYVAGGAANVAANVAALGAEASIIGVVGKDKQAGILEACISLSDKGRVRFVTDATRPTPTKTRFISDNHQLLRLDQETTAFIATDTESTLLEVFDAELEEASVVALSDYAKGVLSDRVLAHIIARARAKGVPVIVDPKRKDFAGYRGATLIAPNRKEMTEATRLPCTGHDDAARAAAIAIKATDAAILLTRSEDGMSLYEAGAEPIHLSTEAHSVVDVTGAGDTVIAVMAVAMGAGLDYVPAIRLANAAAGIVVTKAGTTAITQSELSAYLLARDAQEGAVSTVADDLDQAGRIRKAWKASGLSVGFTNGCFDLLHPGHLSLLRQARSECDRLIVGVNSDASVTRLKGPMRPVQDQASRALMLSALDPVDLVVVFDEDTPLETITALCPDVLVKGADYTIDKVVGADFVQANGGKVVLADLVNGQSTTSLIKRGAAKP